MSCVEKHGALFPSGDDSETAYQPDMDQESNESSADDTESPRSVVEKPSRKRLKSQVLRIRAEHSNLFEDNNSEVHWRRLFVLFSRPMLPASPLGSRTMD